MSSPISKTLTCLLTVLMLSGMGMAHAETVEDFEVTVNNFDATTTFTSDNPDDAEVIYWQQGEAEQTLIITTDDAEQPHTFEETVENLETGEYIFELQAQDSNETQQETVTVEAQTRIVSAEYDEEWVKQGDETTLTVTPENPEEVQNIEAEGYDLTQNGDNWERTFTYDGNLPETITVEDTAENTDQHTIEEVPQENTIPQIENIQLDYFLETGEIQLSGDIINDGADISSVELVNENVNSFNQESFNHVFDLTSTLDNQLTVEDEAGETATTELQATQETSIDVVTEQADNQEIEQTDTITSDHETSIEEFREYSFAELTGETINTATYEMDILVYEENEVEVSGTTETQTLTQEYSVKTEDSLSSDHTGNLFEETVSFTIQTSSEEIDSTETVTISVETGQEETNTYEETDDWIQKEISTETVEDDDRTSTTETQYFLEVEMADYTGTIGLDQYQLESEETGNSLTFLEEEVSEIVSETEIEKNFIEVKVSDLMETDFEHTLEEQEVKKIKEINSLGDYDVTLKVEAPEMEIDHNYNEDTVTVEAGEKEPVEYPVMGDWLEVSIENRTITNTVNAEFTEIQVEEIGGMSIGSLSIDGEEEKELTPTSEGVFGVITDAFDSQEDTNQAELGLLALALLLLGGFIFLVLRN